MSEVKFADMPLVEEINLSFRNIAQSINHTLSFIGKEIEIPEGKVKVTYPPEVVQALISAREVAKHMGEE